jgi:hypothetical protein
MSICRGSALVLACVIGLIRPAAASDDVEAPWFRGWTREEKTVAFNLGLVAAISAYGFAQWEWGSSSFDTTSEGWFGSGTASGGADKLGHAYTAAAITAMSSSLYRYWGHEDERAADLGAFSGLLATGIIEIGDGFSDEHGFSWEDQAFNLLGVGLEYLRQRHPALRERVQFRWEYFPSSEVRSGRDADIFTDYEGSRWMLAFPLRAWLEQDSWLDWVDVLVGYGTRDFDGGRRGSRHPFIGIGLSFPQTKDKLCLPGPDRLWEYLQIPGTAWPLPP